MVDGKKVDGWVADEMGPSTAEARGLSLALCSYLPAKVFSLLSYVKTRENVNHISSDFSTDSTQSRASASRPLVFALLPSVAIYSRPSRP